MDPSVALPCPCFTPPYPVIPHKDSAASCQTRDDIPPSVGTESPSLVPRFTPPRRDGITRESEFDWGDTVIRKNKALEELDKGVPGLATESKVMLSKDSHGILEDRIRMAKNQLACMLCCVPPPFNLCVVFGNCKAHRVLFDKTLDQQIEAASGAHKIYLTENAVVVERNPYATDVVKNFTSVDQYGHKYLGAAYMKERVVKAENHIPLQFAEVEVVEMREFAAPELDPCFVQCCAGVGDCATPQGHVVAIKAAMGGVSITIQCVDVGPAGGAALFKQAFEGLKQKMPPPTEEETSAFTEWFYAKLELSGRMVGGEGFPYHKVVGDQPGKPGQIKKPATSMFGNEKHGEFMDPKFTVYQSGQQMFSVAPDPKIKWMSGDTLVQWGEFNQLAGKTGAEIAEEMLARSTAAGTTNVKVRTIVPTWEPATVLTVGPVANVGATFSTTSPCTILAIAAGSDLEGQAGTGDILLKMVSGDVVVDCSSKNGNEVAIAMQGMQGPITLTILSSRGVWNVDQKFKSELPWQQAI